MLEEFTIIMIEMKFRKIQNFNSRNTLYQLLNLFFLI